MTHSGWSTTRRNLLLQGAGSLAFAACANSVPLKASTKRPNVLFILADDLGYADLSSYGRRDYSTPNLDRLAADGVKLEQAYSNSPVCTPTRVGLITGAYHYRLPIGLEEPLQKRDVGLPPDAPTMPDQFQKAGYRTSLIGKWHMGTLPDYNPLQSGYDIFWGFRGGGVDYFTHKELGGVHGLWDGDTKIDEVGYLTDLLADRAISEIRQAAGGSTPFFMSLHFNAPHWPFEGPADEAEAARLDAQKNPFALYHVDGGGLKAYADLVTRLDSQIGRILDTLRTLGLERDTIVVFTSDNGGERFSDNWPFIGRKGEVLEGGIRVPAIVKWPGNIAAGQVSQVPNMSMDWLPTLAAMTGTPIDPDMTVDGVDISPAFMTASEIVERPLFWRFKAAGQSACRLGDWKYLEIAGHSFLFNLADDPMERANLKRRYPDIFDDLRQRYAAWNETMLPLDPESQTHVPTGEFFADRYTAGMAHED